VKAVTLQDVCAGDGKTYITSGSQQGCWVLAAAGESCTAACDTLDDTAKEIDASCVADAGSGEGTWNDPSCTICMGLNPSAVCWTDEPGNTSGEPSNSPYAPFYFFGKVSGIKRCEYRKEGVNAECVAVPLKAAEQRVCRCE